MKKADQVNSRQLLPKHKTCSPSNGQPVSVFSVLWATPWDLLFAPWQMTSASTSGQEWPTDTCALTLDSDYADAAAAVVEQGRRREHPSLELQARQKRPPRQRKQSKLGHRVWKRMALMLFTFCIFNAQVLVPLFSQSDDNPQSAMG